jgi:hypothetical protein
MLQYTGQYITIIGPACTSTSTLIFDWAFRNPGERSERISKEIEFMRGKVIGLSKLVSSGTITLRT